MSNAGLLLVATVTARLGLEPLIDATVRLVGKVGGFRPGRKVLTLVHAMIARRDPHRSCRHAPYRVDRPESVGADRRSDPPLVDAALKLARARNG